MQQFHKVAAEPLVLPALPDKPLGCATLLLQLAHHGGELIRRRGWARHQVCTPVQKSDISTQWPAVQRSVHPVAESGSRHEVVFISLVKPWIQGFKPTGGHILRQPGHIHQQCIKGGGTQQEAADGQIGNGFRFQGASADVEMNPPAVVIVEPIHQCRCGIGVGGWHQDRDRLHLLLTAPDDTHEQDKSEPKGDQAAPKDHQPMVATSGKLASCSSAQSCTV